MNRVTHWKETKGYHSLEQLALDMRWSWNHRTDNLWKQIDPMLWSLTHNPWVVLQTVSTQRLEELFKDPAFSQAVEQMTRDREEASQAATWFQKKYADSPLKTIAYFSMEFMLSEALPIYSGGLGNVAGDQLKAASDLGVPVIAIGLLYQQGYFRQMIDKNGAQQALYPYNDPGQLPISPYRKPDGEWLRLEIAMPGWSVWLRVWEVRVGRCTLYLLDSNDAANFPAHRGITSELYGGDSELRIKQEIVLGIGGWKFLEALGINPEVCHLNEGHAAFAILERARSFMNEAKIPFDAALAATRAGNLFTTHTAVPAGFDRFSPFLIEQYLGHYAKDQLGISLDDLLALGRQNRFDSFEPFNMAYLAVRGSGFVNGVSRLHQTVSQSIFEPLFPRWPKEEVPVGHVTNGVHMPTWDSPMADKLWTETCGKDRWLNGNIEELEKKMKSASDARIWQMRNEARKAMVEHGRARFARLIEARGMPAEEVEKARHVFDPDALTLGFARRFATYKRPNMLLSDPARLLRILSSTDRPVQLVLAGKAHPADKPGQELIQQWIQFIRKPEVRPHIIFLNDYDMLVTERLVQGVDVWINTPRRPWEASGTSGMKVLVNGGLNLSELDGWWAEAYEPDVGWAIGDGQEHGNDPSWDTAEANALYEILEQKIVPEFYTRDEKGIPKAWVNRIRESMARLTPRFSANRAVCEYTEEFYLPAAAQYRKRTADQGAIGKQIVQWRQIVEQSWSKLHFGEVKIETRGNEHFFDAQVYLDGLDPSVVKVELYANGMNGEPPLCKEMARAQQLAGSTGGYTYRAAVPAARPAKDYTARVIPYFPGVAVPLASAQILWQK